MSAVIAVPELMDQAATDLATIGDTLNAAHMTAAVPTVAVLPAAADEVSTSIAHLFSGYGQEYQKLAREAAAFSDHFAQTLKSGGAAYAATEATSAASLLPLSAAEGIEITSIDDLRPILGVALFLLFLAWAGLLVGLISLPFLPIGLLNIVVGGLPYGLPYILASLGI